MFTVLYIGLWIEQIMQCIDYIYLINKIFDGYDYDGWATEYEPREFTTSSFVGSIFVDLAILIMTAFVFFNWLILYLSLTRLTNFLIQSKV